MCLGGPANAYLSMHCRSDTRDCFITVLANVQDFKDRYMPQATRARPEGYLSTPVDPACVDREHKIARVQGSSVSLTDLSFTDESCTPTSPH